MYCGTYLLRFAGTDKVYIGQSVDINSRYSGHKRHFLAGIQPVKLQAGYIEFGMPSLEIIITCPREELNEAEDSAIEIWDSVNNGFNTLKSSTSSPTEGHPGEKHWNSKYSNSKIIEVFEYLISMPDSSLRNISNYTDVSYLVVKDIAGCVKHKWLEKVFPEKYSILRSMTGTRASKGLSSFNLGLKYPALISPEGVIYRDIQNVSSFAKEHNLGSGNLWSVLRGHAAQHKGWKIVPSS